MTRIADDDIEAILADVVANRPGFLHRTELNADHAAWAIVELERAGIHPSLGLIAHVIGRGTQRALTPFVNAFYRHRSQTPAAPPFDPRDEALRDLYDALAKHIRQDLQNEFASETHRLEDAHAALERRKVEVENKLFLATERMRAAEALGEGIRRELDEGRNERVALQTRHDQTLQELAQAKQTQEDLQQRLRVAAEDHTLLLAHAEKLTWDSNAVHARAAAIEERLSASERSAANIALERDESRSRVSVATREALTERAKSQELQRRVDELVATELRLREKLYEAQSRLSRERSIRAVLDGELQTEKSHAKTCKREFAASIKKAAELQRAIDEAKAEKASLGEQLNVSRREGRRLEARLLRLERANRRQLLAPTMSHASD